MAPLSHELFMILYINITVSLSCPVNIQTNCYQKIAHVITFPLACTIVSLLQEEGQTLTPQPSLPQKALQDQGMCRLVPQAVLSEAITKKKEKKEKNLREQSYRGSIPPPSYNFALLDFLLDFFCGNCVPRTPPRDSSTHPTKS